MVSRVVWSCTCTCLWTSAHCIRSCILLHIAICCQWLGDLQGYLWKGHVLYWDHHWRALGNKYLGISPSWTLSGQRKSILPFSLAQLLSFIIYIIIIVVIFKYINRNLMELATLIRDDPDTEGREGAFMSATDPNDRRPANNTAADKSKMLK